MLSEIRCLEETLVKRRTELREADELLHDCRENLKDARQEVGTCFLLLKKIVFVKKN